MGIHSAKESQSASVARKDSRHGRVLAIDYGRKRIGLAISDDLGLTARPLRILDRRGRAEDFARLGDIVREQKIGRIIVGRPLRMDGSTGEMATEAERFANRLEQALGLPVELRDERLTSWAADRWLAEHPRRGRGRANDDVAAAILLDEYLKTERGSG